MIEDLETELNRIYGPSQFDWTIGKSPEGWFYYCGHMETPSHPKGDWKHGGHEPTLVAVLEKMISLEFEESNRLTVEAKELMERIEA